MVILVNYTKSKYPLLILEMMVKSIIKTVTSERNISYRLIIEIYICVQTYTLWEVLNLI